LYLHPTECLCCILFPATVDLPQISHTFDMMGVLYTSFPRGSTKLQRFKDSTRPNHSLTH
jgi:hypothetical protein